MIELNNPPPTEERREWFDWFQRLFVRITFFQLPVKTDSTRGSAGNVGRLIYNSTDGKLNIDNGTAWTLPDGTVT